MSQERIAIIGGGMTGLALAYFLGQAGRRVTIIEKGSQLSGLLAFTFVNGLPIERFYHHFFTTDRYFLELVDELNLGDKIFWRESASAVYHDGHLSPFITKSDYLRLPFLPLSAKLRAATAAVRLRLRPAEKISPELTAEEFLRDLFGRVGWETMWRPLLINKFGERDARRLSAQWIAKRIQIRASSERHGREVLGYLHGSYRVLFDALQAAILQQGGQIVLNTEVTAINTDSVGQLMINSEPYDAVVSTIAPHLIKTIVPALDFPDVTYRGAICPLFWLRTAPTQYYWLNILDENVPFSVVVNQSALLPTHYYQGLHPLYVGHYVAQTSELFSMPEAELIDYYLTHLKKIFPGIESTIAGYEISRTKFAQPVITAPWKPLSHRTNIPQLYLTSMAHIFPEDRGANYAIREAKRLAAILMQ